MKKYRKMTSVLSSVFCLFGTIALNAQGLGDGVTKDKLDVYLLIGQSNMAGRAPYSEEEAEPISRCYLLNGSDEWGVAKNPFNLYSTVRKEVGMQKMGPGYLFSKTMLKKNKGGALGLVVNAKGGSSINQWTKGSKFYNEAVRRVRIAQKTGVVKGILWHQGEADVNDIMYLDKLKKLIENLRNDIGDEKLPFIAGQINKGKNINDQVAKLPQVVPYTGYASSDGLVAMDRWHFDNKSMKLLGKRYAEAMIKVQTRLKEGK